MVGGFASQLHGARRQTYDIDFVPATTAANDDRLASALREPGARLRVAGLTDEEARQLPVTIDAATLQAFGSTTWTTDTGPLAVLRELPVTGARRTYEELIQRCTDVAVDGIVIHRASLDDIIDSKTHADRPKTTTPSPNSTTSAEQHAKPDHEYAASPAKLVPAGRIEALLNPHTALGGASIEYAYRSCGWPQTVQPIHPPTTEQLG